MRKFASPTKDLIGKSVRVYWNLHEDCWSVLHKGLVVAHCSSIRLTNASFKVLMSGYDRFQREQRKNVHAFVCGQVIEYNQPKPENHNCQVTYNPRVAPTFHTVDKIFKGREYHFDEHARFNSAFMGDKKVFVSNS